MRSEISALRLLSCSQPALPTRPPNPPLAAPPASQGPTRAEITQLAADTSSDAHHAWVDAQIALPPSLHRAHYRRRANPRLAPNARATAALRPACQPGSRWTRFALSKRDESRTLTMQRNLGSGALEYRIDGALRAEAPAGSLPVDASGAPYASEGAAYTMAFEGRCHEPVGSLDECTAAALALNVSWFGQYWRGGVDATEAPAVDDGRSGSSSAPPGCYLEGSSWRHLRFNVAGGNDALCNPYRICLCRAYEPPSSAPVSFTICRVQEKVDGNVRLVAAGLDPATACHPSSRTESRWFTVRNPAVAFSSVDPSHAQTFEASEVSLQPMDHRFEPDVFILRSALPSCRLSAQPALTHMRAGAVWYALDRRIEWLQNDLDAPAALGATSQQLDGYRAMCPTAPKTFLNRAGCVRSATCAPIRYTSAPLVLNASTSRLYYEEAGSLVYQIRSLRLEENYDSNPCDAGARTRWLRSDGACTADTPLDSTTRQTIVDALTGSRDPNPHVRDVTVASPASGGCAASLNGVSAFGARLTVGGSCWRHTHPHEGNMYEYSYWRLAHPGNDQFPESQNPIEGPAKRGEFILDFPSSHNMDERWLKQLRNLAYLGRVGDVVDFQDLPAAAQSTEVAVWLGAIGTVDDDGTEACGSPGEVANVPTLSHRYRTHLANDERSMAELQTPHGGNMGKMMVWSTVVLQAPDQLRQRVAWGLSQIFVIGVEGLSKSDEMEIWHTYYDIMVRCVLGDLCARCLLPRATRPL